VQGAKLENNRSGPVLPHYYLNSHTDEDFFYPLTAIVSKHHGTESDKMDRYEMDAQVCSYFVFAEQGGGCCSETYSIFGPVPCH
jgi:hypothetical protein